MTRTFTFAVWTRPRVSKCYQFFLEHIIKHLFMVSVGVKRTQQTPDVQPKLF